MVDAEELFGQFVVQLGLAKPEKVKECLALLRGKQTSKDKTPRLAHLLIDKGYLDLTLFEQTINEDPAGYEKTVLDNRKGKQSSAPQKTPKGEVFGKYIKNRILGTGGMGDVWKAWDTELERWVAIKFLRGEDSKDLARFRREAQTAAKLTHPGITAIYEAGENFIVMQLIEGNSLSNLPLGDHRLIASVMKQTAEALHFAHQNGIIHRDIKPANILFQENKETNSPEKKYEVFLTDFGLAKPMDIDSSLSVTGAIMGTPSYMSPEQADGHRVIDNRTDIFSLGATLYYLLTARMPFFDENAYRVAKKVIEEEPIPIRKTNPDVPLDLQTITMKCMEKDRSARYGNALEVAEELNRYLNNEPIHARPISKSEMILRYIKNHSTVLLPSAAAVLLGLGILGWIGTSTYLRSRHLRTEIKHTRDYISQATGEPRERLKLYRLALQSIDGAITLSPENEEALNLRKQIHASVEKIELDAEVEQKRLKERLAQKTKLTLMAKVLGGWERLHETLEKLEEIHFDSTLTEEERTESQTELWSTIAAFKKTIPQDSASQAMGLALTGWSRVIAGNEKEGIEWLNQARTLEPQSPYAFFLKALIRFEDILETEPVENSSFISGVQWWTPSSSQEMKSQISSLLGEIQESSLWVEESMEAYEFAIQGTLHFVQGQYKKAEAEFTESIATPEMIVFQADFRIARAQVRIYQRKYIEAISDLRRIRVLRPRQFLAPFLLGLSYEALSQKRPAEAREIEQNRAEAIAHFKTAGSLSKNCWQAWVHAGVLYEEAGEKENASNAYLQALDITSTMNPKPDLSKIEAAFKRVSKR
jgi:serine/threonine protein kinase